MSRQGGGGDGINNNAQSENPARQETDAPEKALTHFALRLALLEKTATGLGTLGFIWATVVLLGGFAITLDTTDFWFITVILVIEGTRIFSRSHELEWQHQATWSTSDVIAASSNLAVGRSSSNDVERQLPPAQPFFGSPLVFITQNITKILYWLQLLSATTCVVLSLIKLIKHDFGHVEKGDTDKKNRQAALFIFYSLALAEASLFVMEKVYWEWTTGFLRLLENVNNQYGLEEGMISTKRFFYDAYSKSINGSVFDSLRMDMISFAAELLTSNSPNEQLIGARLLRKLSKDAAFSTATLRKIGVDIHVVERLVEMLNWRNPNEQEIRESAAEILGLVASQTQNSLRIAEIPGAVESVASLLRTDRQSYTSAGDEICQRGNSSDQVNRNVQNLNDWGLRILNELSRDHDNCGKIGNTRGLLPKIIHFTYASEAMFRDPGVPEFHITSVRRSLELVKMLVSTTGVTGGNLRKEISEIVFTIINVRNILKHGNQHSELQLLGIQVLTHLGLEDDATEKIGGTGGVLEELVNIFFLEGATGDRENLRSAAGDAIAMLTLESKNNCHRLLQLGAMEKLVTALMTDEALCINTARILRNLCIYTEDARFKDTLLRVVAAAPTVSLIIYLSISETRQTFMNSLQVLKAILTATSNKQQEVMIGLALYVFKNMKPEEFSSSMLGEEGHCPAKSAAALVQILRKHPIPSIEVPRIRRFTIELAIWMMHEWKESVVGIFRGLGMEKELKRVIQTTTEIENFHLFSGTVGISRYVRSIHSLVEEALILVA